MAFGPKHARVPARKGGHKARAMVSASNSIKPGNRIRRNKLNLPAGGILQFPCPPCGCAIRRDTFLSLSLSLSLRFKVDLSRDVVDGFWRQGHGQFDPFASNDDETDRNSPRPHGARWSDLRSGRKPPPQEAAFVETQLPCPSSS